MTMMVRMATQAAVAAGLMFRPSSAPFVIASLVDRRSAEAELTLRARASPCCVRFVLQRPVDVEVDGSLANVALQSATSARTFTTSL